MRVVCCSVTDAGEAVARRLPYEHRRGRLVATVAELWDEVDAFVLIAATGIAVRAIAPHLVRKDRDPAVVCVDDRGRHAIALSGGHAAGANRLAEEVAALTGAQPVVTTATDLAGLPALDDDPGMGADGDVAAVTRAWLDGSPPSVHAAAGLEDWPLPPALRALRDEPDPGGTGRGGAVTVTDGAGAPGPAEVYLRPRSLVAGVGASSGAGADALWQLLQTALDESGLDRRSIGAVATVDLKLTEAAVTALAARLGVPLRAFEAASLAAVEVPNPSDAVRAAVGTPSVAEAAALLAAGPGADLVVTKRVSPSRDSTLAVARRARPEGHLAVVGLGPGRPSQRTPEAAAAVRAAEVVVGYSGYVDLAADLLSPRQEVLRSPIGAEADRCSLALRRAADGQRVALVCSGDPGVYAMASLVCELAPGFRDPPLTVVPGVTAALSGAGLLGAPLGHDHAAISLSDLLTPWDTIARRLRAAADGDFVVSLYNPRSNRRTTQLPAAIEILSSSRPPGTPAAVLTDIGRPGEQVERTTLAELDPSRVGMLSLVVVGSSSTRWVSGRMVTPRGYDGHAPGNAPG